MAVILLVELPTGDTVGVNFPTRDLARAWEDEHEAELLVRGCVDVVSADAALESSNQHYV